MATLAGLPVRCRVYRDRATLGFTTGCGSTDVKATPQAGADFHCNTCHLTFSAPEVQYDRKVLTDRALRSAHDSRIANGRYIKRFDAA